MTMYTYFCMFLSVCIILFVYLHLCVCVFIVSEVFLWSCKGFLGDHRMSSRWAMEGKECPEWTVGSGVALEKPMYV